MQIFYRNVAHPKLAAYVKTNSWVLESGEYLVFPQNQSSVVGGVGHYLESIEEVLSVPLICVLFVCVLACCKTITIVLDVENLNSCRY